jgi:hypothetical protein
MLRRGIKYSYYIKILRVNIIKPCRKYYNRLVNRLGI